MFQPLSGHHLAIKIHIIIIAKSFFKVPAISILGCYMICSYKMLKSVIYKYCYSEIVLTLTECMLVVPFLKTFCFPCCPQRMWLVFTWCTILCLAC